MKQEETLLKIENLTKIFVIGGGLARSKLVAVDGVSFQVNPAEIFTLAGESGSGKTTVAKIVLGFEEPTSGKIQYKNKKAIDLKNRKERMWFMKEVQAVFQNPFETFNPLRTVDSYLYETALNYNMAKKRNDATETVQNALKLVGLSLNEIKEKYPNEFSGGQLQRISLARSLITHPSLLIADEPVSMVDASLRMSIVNLFKELKEKHGVSVVYITHDLATAYYVSDRIAIMFRGNIIEMGPVEKVLISPKHPYTQILKESIPEPNPQRRWKERIDISELETEEYMRIGCKFAGRCSQAKDICKEKMPDEILVDGRMVRCWLYTEKVNS